MSEVDMIGVGVITLFGVETVNEGVEVERDGSEKKTQRGHREVRSGEH